MREAGDGSRAALEAALRDPVSGASWEPWLVYADWLTERGDPRGQLIVLEHRRATARMRDAEARELDAQIAALRERDAIVEALTLPELDEDSVRVELRSGFVIGLTLPLDAEHLVLLERGFADDRLALLGRLRLRVPVDIDEELAWDDPDYAPDAVAPELVEQLLALPLAGLPALALCYGALGEQGLAALASCAALASLRELDLRYSYLDGAGLRLLCASPHLARLRSFIAHRNHLAGAAIAPLATSWSLRQLDLRENALGPAGAQILAEAPALASLDELGLLFDDVGREGASALARSAYLPFAIRRYWSAQYSVQRAPPRA